jgi:hypothetical protein
MSTPCAAAEELAATKEAARVTVDTVFFSPFRTE